MTKSKIYLGLGSLLLTASGAFAHAASHRVTPVYWQDGNICRSAAIDSQCSPGDPTCQELVPGGGLQFVFQTKSTDGSTCLVPLHAN
jgi:hypothetical protein